MNISHISLSQQFCGTIHNHVKAHEKQSSTAACNALSGDETYLLRLWQKADDGQQDIILAFIKNLLGKQQV